ncbi:LysR family transcriptional regulator [Herbiconiux sp. L3-i23]|uniref:LysR family transcriptional regulator n=1 Tax=Herbiconiux sp. L3-i23 TaxID=2905871 RepID=UPI00205B5373|nr:LysR family transcriptional regulator [Herbiconiux sp. L3-i23]BDI23204.1 LysR family transcriptional regulator [Herbiconiux sp. L3-i23]
MRISQLRAFATAARLGSFTAAARELGLAQPTVSELVRALEQGCGLELFVRGGRRLVLTAAGEQLLPWARQATDSVDGAEDLVRSLRGISGGVASFGVLRNAEFYLLSPLAQEFHHRYPGVQIRLVGQNSVSVAEAVRAGELEAGLVVLPVPHEGLDVRPLLRDEVVWVSRDASRTRKPMTIGAIPEAPLILYDAQYGSSDPTRRQLTDRAQAAGVRIDPLIEVENVDTALALVARGLGDTMVASAVTRSALFPPGLTTTPFAEPLHDVIALVRRERSTLSPVSQALADLATDMLLRGDTTLTPPAR